MEQRAIGMWAIDGEREKEKGKEREEEREGERKEGAEKENRIRG